MTDIDKIAYVKVLLGEDIADNVIVAYLLKAKNTILNRRYINRKGDEEFPQKYNILQCELACRYIKRQDTDGEKNHSENGISRSFESINDEDLLSEVLPMAVI